jgi:hypothetical protein
MILRVHKILFHHLAGMSQMFSKIARLFFAQRFKIKFLALVAGA